MIVVVPSDRSAKFQAESSPDAVLLRTLAQHEWKSVRIAVAENTAADDRTIERLLADEVGDVRLAAAASLRERPQLHGVAARSPDRWVRAILADLYADDDRRSLARALQERLAADPFSETRARTARTTDDADIFESLLTDASPLVRGTCACNPRITLAQMERLVTDRDRRVRAGAATGGLRYPDDEQLLRLARDRSIEVRWAVLFRADRPWQAIELIAQDSDEWNRRHALIALDDERDIIAPAATQHARAGRRRAERLRSFDHRDRGTSGPAAGVIADTSGRYAP